MRTARLFSASHGFQVVVSGKVALSPRGVHNTMTDLHKLTSRVEALERQNRRFRFVAVAFILLAAVGSLATGSSKSRTIEAEQFIVRDSQGRARVTIATAPAAGAAVSLSPDEPAVWFSDEKGRDRLILATDGLRLANSKSQPALDVTAGSIEGQPASIRLYDSNSHVVWSAP
jgi:hypothetical protein